MSKTTREHLVLSLLSLLPFLIGWWLFGPWEGAAMMISYMIGMTVIVLIDIWSYFEE